MNLLSTAELAWRQLFPNPSDEATVEKEEFIETAKLEYALQVWVLSKNEKKQEGVFDIPSILLSTATLPVKDNMIDLTGLEVLRSLSGDSWLQNIGGLTCSCRYVKSNINQRQLLCDDDSLPDDSRLFFISGNRVLFPRGTHAEELEITYANKGLEINEEELEIDDAIASIIRNRLVEIYGGKIGKEDVTNNSNSTV